MQTAHATADAPGTGPHWLDWTSTNTSPTQSIFGDSGVSTATSSSQDLRENDDDSGDKAGALPPHRQREILDQATVTVGSVLQSMLVDRHAVTSFLLKSSKHGVESYVDTSAPSSQYRVCFMSETTTPVEELMNVLVATTSESLVANYRTVFKNVLYARVLNVLSHPTKAEPFKAVTLSYACFETPKLLANKDVCLATSTDVFTHVDGSTVGYCLWDSIDHPSCPDYSKSFGIHRTKMSRSGFVLRSTTDGYETTTKIVYLVGVELGGLATRIATKRLIDRYGGHVTRLCRHFQQQQIDAATFTPRGDWTPKGDAKFCKACVKRFSALSIKHNCVACGEIVCKACNSRRSVYIPGVGQKSVRVCVPCLDVRGIDVLRTPMALFSTRESRRRPTYSPQSVDGGGF